MRVSDCESCEHCQRRVWSQYYKPNGYHAIGMSHAYAYCTKHQKRVRDVRKCDENIRKTSERMNNMEEVRHGHWIWNENDECWVCDSCGDSALNNYRGNSADSLYCPHCGLKMYEEESTTA